MANPRLYSNLKDFKFDGPVTDPWNGAATAPDATVRAGWNQYPNPVSPEQIKGFSGYQQDPREDAGRRRIARQFLDAPFGGHVRDFGVNQLGLNNAHGIAMERTLAGLTATGIGVPAFLAAVQGLNTPDTAETIPLA